MAVDPMSMPWSPGGTPEVIAGLRVDGRGLREATGELEKQDSLWKSISGSVGGIDTAVGKIGGFVAGLAGVAGIGALAAQFVKVGDAASSLATATGRISGGVGTYQPYGSSLNRVQAATGVSASATAQGLIAAIQMVGGRASPQQAMTVGALLAGYGQAVGLSPSQVASIIAPMLLSTGQGVGGASGVAAILMGGLSAFPGSQAQPAMGVVASMVSQLLPGAGRALNTGTTAQATALVNAMAQLNPALFGHGNVRNQNQAWSAISSSIQEGYLNPSMEAFLRLSGLSYQQQRLGATPANLLKITQEADRLYPNAQTRDMAMRSMFGGVLPADYLNTLMGPGGQKALHTAIAGGGGARMSIPQLDHILQGLQARSAPSAVANRATAGILQAIFGPLSDVFKFIAGNPVLAGTLGIGLAVKGPSIVRGLGGALSDAVEGAGAGSGDFLGGLLSIGGKAFGLGIGTAAGMLAFPDSANATLPSGRKLQQLQHYGRVQSVIAVMEAANRKFGGKLTPESEAWMRRAISSGSIDPGGHVVNSRGQVGWGSEITQPQIGATTTLLDQVLRQILTAANGQDPSKVFQQAVDKFSAAISKLSGGGGAHTTAAVIGGSNPGVMLTAAATSTPGQVYGALSSLIAGNTMLTAAVTPGGGGGGGGGAGGGGAISASWDTAVRHYSGNSYGVSYLNSLLPGPMHGGVKNDRQMVASAAGGVPFALLWAIYGAESTWGKASNWFGLVSVPRTGSFAGDAHAAARTLASLYQSSQKTGGGRTITAAARSGGGGGAADAQLMAMIRPPSGSGSSGGGGGGSTVVLNVDGRKLAQYQRLTRGAV